MKQGARDGTLRSVNDSTFGSLNHKSLIHKKDRAMNRRQFSTQLSLMGLSTGLVGAPAWAQGGPVEGKHFLRLDPPQPQAAGGKIEVIEFFWYGCPHCFHFDPALEAWTRNLPANVTFRRSHIAFGQAVHKAHQKLYYTLDAMGVEAALHMKIFNAMHVERQLLDKPEAMADFVAKSGQDKAKFLSLYDSFSIQSKCQAATKLMTDYKVDGVPMLAVGGKFTTSVSTAGQGMPEGEAAFKQTLAVTDYLIKRASVKA